MTKNPAGFAERSIEPGNVSNSESDCVGVEGFVGKGETFGIAIDKGKARLLAHVAGFFPADTQHIETDIAADRVGLRSRGLQKSLRHIARAPRNIKKPVGPMFWRRQPGNEFVLPYSVQAARHQIIHQIITLRHTGKDLVYQGLFVFNAHGFESETRGFGIVIVLI